MQKESPKFFHLFDYDVLQVFLPPIKGIIVSQLTGGTDARQFPLPRLENDNRSGRGNKTKTKISVLFDEPACFHLPHADRGNPEHKGKERENQIALNSPNIWKKLLRFSEFYRKVVDFPSWWPDARFPYLLESGYNMTPKWISSPPLAHCDVTLLQLHGIYDVQARAFPC